MPNPHPDRVRLRGPAFDPGDAVRPAEIEHFDHWQDLVDKRLIGNIQELSPETLAWIDAAERALRVGKYRWRA